MNTEIAQVNVEDDKITSVAGVCLTNETAYTFYGDNFLDATGDGFVGYLAGAEFMTGREGKKVFNEEVAVNESDDFLMGNSLMFTAKDVGHEVPFVKPFWAKTYTIEDLQDRNLTDFKSGYWWIELGGDDQYHPVDDYEELRDELLKVLYGVWDYIKTHDERAKNYALDWVQFLPGKRESRRLVGDYVLTANDLLNGRTFFDAVAYGGWPMDMHTIGGINILGEPNKNFMLEDVYQIPYRSLYAKNISNLFLGGRNISASHMAFGSTRVMATCGVIGEALGIASSLAKKYTCTPREVIHHVAELQQLCLKADLYIPHLKNTDENDLALTATVSASSSQPDCPATNVINGVARAVGKEANCWRTIASEPAWLALDFDKMITIQQLQIKFDSNLSKEIMPSLAQHVLVGQDEVVQKSLVKDFTVEILKGGQVVAELPFTDDYLRHVTIDLPAAVKADRIRIKCFSTNGTKDFTINEVRVY